MTHVKNSLFPNTYGLVVCGGNSSRMGNDKSLLQYYNRPQRYHVYEMLIPCCEKVFISCNAFQSLSIEDSYNIITDNDLFNDIGPMAALLSAFSVYPGKNMLLIGCDYPFLTLTEIQNISSYCKDEAVSFYNEVENIYEPLLAWYPFSTFDKLKIMHSSKMYSLQHFLKDSRALKFYPEDKKSITSIDTHEDYIKALKTIKA